MKVNRNDIKVIYFLFIITPLFFSSCLGGRGIFITPPIWIQGTWQGGPDEEYSDYFIWTFTEDNAVYEYHNPITGVEVSLDLLTDFSNAWVRDKVEEEEMNYHLFIDGNDHYFCISYDGETETYDESTLLYSEPSGGWEGRELIKQ